MVQRAYDVCYVLPGKTGGVVSIVSNLLAERPVDSSTHGVVLTDNALDVDTRFSQPLPADYQVELKFKLPIENLYRVLDRLADTIPRRPGVLVSNDLLELAMCCRHDPGRAVIQVLHGDHDYYYDLAVRHSPVIDAYVTYSRAMYERLYELLPERRAEIFHLPYGIRLPQAGRQPAPGPLRLLFAGRLEHGQKGVLDLPQIDRGLRDLGVAARWTIAGDGPDRAKLEQAFAEAGNVRFLGTLPNADVLKIAAEQDVFVLPTRAEGFPVALVEAMGVGLVPIVSDIASGVPEVVEPEVHGFRPAVGDIDGFAADIARLAQDRELLEAMSSRSRALVAERFDIRDRAGAYHALFARWQELRRPRPRRVPLPYGSRLDRPWLPNSLVYPMRYSVRWLQGKTVA
jgi:glycosyltransferase involved in cell wall biosynthesis